MLVRRTTMQVDVLLRYLPSPEIIYRNEATDIGLSKLSGQGETSLVRQKQILASPRY